MGETYNLDKTKWFVNTNFGMFLLAGFPTVFIIIFLIYVFNINLPLSLADDFLYTIFNFSHVLAGLSVVYLYRQEVKEKPVQFIWIPLIFISIIIILVLSNYRHFWFFRIYWGSLHLLIQDYYILGIYKLKAKDYLKIDNVIDNAFLITLYSDYAVRRLQFTLKGIGLTVPTINTWMTIQKHFLRNVWNPLIMFIVIAFIFRQAYLFFRYKKVYPFKIFMFSAIFSCYYCLLVLTRKLIVAQNGVVQLHSVRWVSWVWFYHRQRFKEGLVKGSKFISYVFKPYRPVFYLLALGLISIAFNFTFTFRMSNHIKLVHEPVALLHFIIDAIIWRYSRMRSIVTNQ